MEVARLGMEIDARGIPQTRAELLELAKSAQDTARSFTSAGAAIESSGTRIANAPDGFTAFETKAAKADSSFKQVGNAAISTAINVANLGIAGNVAGKALQSFALAPGPVGIGLALIATTAALVTYEIDKTRESLRQLSEKELAEISRQTADLKLEQDIKRQIRGFEALDPELEAIKIKYDDIRAAAERANVSASKIAIINKKEAADIRKLQDERFNAIAKEQQGIQAQIAAAQFEAQAIGLTGDALIQLNTQQKINAIAADDMAKKHGALTNELIKETAAVGALQRAQQLINSGQGAAAQAEQQFGVSLAVNRDKDAVTLAQKFIPLFKAAGNDPALRAEASQMFASLVQQLSASGTQNISGLLSSLGLSSREIADLRAGLGSVLTGYSEKLEEVQVQQRNVFGNLETVGTTVQATLVPQIVSIRDLLDQSDQKTKNWTDSMARTIEQYGQIGRAGSEVEEMLSRIAELAREKLAIAIDTAPALASLQQVEQQAQRLKGLLGSLQAGGGASFAPTSFSSFSSFGSAPSFFDFESNLLSATGIDAGFFVTS